MSEQLYNTAILRLASAIPHEGALADADASVTRVSPICGSRVSAHVALDAQGHVARFGQEVRACALGQAAAAILGTHVVGLNAQQLAAARDGLAAYLDGKGEGDAPWPDLAVFAPALPYRARHASIRLAFEAAAEAAARAASDRASLGEAAHAA